MQLRSMLVLGVLGFAAPLAAQDAPPPPTAGLASFGLSGGIGPAPSGTAWSAGMSYLPFFTNHLQFGGGVTYFGATGPTDTEGVSANLGARYLFGSDTHSAPFVAAAFGATGAQNRTAASAGVVSVGWLQFLTPLTAIDARISATRSSAGGSTVATLSIGPSTFVPALSTGMRAAPQSTGAFDWSGNVNAGLTQQRHYGASAQYAPFLSEWLQVGAGGSANYQEANHITVQGTPLTVPSVTTLSLNGMVRLFYPADWPVHPFVDLTGSTTSQHFTTTQTYHGFTASLGLRRYLTGELAADLRLVRQLSNSQPVPLNRSMRLTLGLTLHQPR